MPCASRQRGQSAPCAAVGASGAEQRGQIVELGGLSLTLGTNVRAGKRYREKVSKSARSSSSTSSGRATVCATSSRRISR